MKCSNKGVDEELFADAVRVFVKFAKICCVIPKDCDATSKGDSYLSRLQVQRINREGAKRYPPGIVTDSHSRKYHS